MIEEFSESDDRGFRLSISRNVSIVSMSDDEIMRQTPLPLDTPEPSLAKQFTFERKESVEISEKKSEVEDIDDSMRKKRVSFVPDDINRFPNYDKQIDENLSGPQSVRNLVNESLTLEESEKPLKVINSNGTRNSSSEKRMSIEQKEVLRKESLKMQDSEISASPIEVNVDAKMNSILGKRMSIEQNEEISLTERSMSINSDLSNSQIAKSAQKESITMQESEKPQDLQEFDVSTKRKSISGKKMSIEQKKEMTFSDENYQTVISDNVKHPKSGKLEEDNEPFGSSLSRKASVERRESFSKVEVKNITESRKSSQSFIFNEFNKAELFDNVQSIPKATDKDDKYDEALIEINNDAPSRKASIERRESFSMVEVKNIIESRKSSQSFIFEQVNKAELFDNLKSIPKAMDKDEKVEEALAETNNTLSRKASVTDELKKSRKASVESIDDDDDNTGDSRTDELIKKIKKQRSILEEIIDKEDERSVEGIQIQY